MLHRCCLWSVSRARGRALLFGLSLLTLAFSPLAEAKRPHHAQPDAAQAAAGKDRPGVFDYYLLTLSWSPQYCSGHADDTQQCGTDRHHGFVVHGLWPQYDSGYPQSCSSEPLDEKLVGDYLDIMPSTKLVRHEWQKHGTCSGLKPAEYFGAIRRVFGSVAVPDQYKRPSRPVAVKLQQFKRDLAAANPGLDANEFAVACKGKYLNEVRICYDKSLQPQACRQSVRDSCSAPSVVLRAVQ